MSIGFRHAEGDLQGVVGAIGLHGGGHEVQIGGVCTGVADGKSSHDATSLSMHGTSQAESRG
jgi:hypothetical protein